MSFFKRLFKSKPEIISLYELEPWFKDNVKTDLSGIKQSYQELENVKKDMLEKIRVLERVDISNVKVEHKLRVMVKANRDTYINEVKNLLRRINPFESVNYQSIISFEKAFKEKLEAFNKKTAKNYYITQQLIGKELQEVVKSIQKMSLIVKNIRNKAERNNLLLIEQTQRRINSVKEFIDAKDQKQDIKRKKEEEYQKVLEEKRKLQRHLASLETGKEMGSLEDNKQKLRDLEKKQNRIKNKLISLFAPLEKAMKKYCNMYHIKTLDAYIENPMLALLEDEKLDVVRYLLEIKQALDKNTLDLKYAKKEKTLELIDSTSISLLSELRESYNNNLEKIKKILREISDNTILSKVNSIKQSIKLKEGDIEDKHKALEEVKEVNIKQELSHIEESLKELGHPVAIKNVMGN